MYKIKNAGAKGLGVFATKWIPVGTRIMAERPLFSVRNEGDVYAAIRNLPQQDADQLMRLSATTDSASSIIDRTKAVWHLTRNGALPTMNKLAEYMSFLAVFRNNNFDIGNNIQAIFRDVCRLNHSCVPNCQGNFNTAIEHFTIHATRPIEPDDEITISYLNEHGATRDARQAKLLQGYGFPCDCPVCDLSTETGRRSNERRVQMRDKLRDFAERASESEAANSADEMQLMRELIQMFEDEGLAGRELSTMYLSAAEANLSNSDREGAKRYAKFGLGMEEACLGNDNPVFHESVRRMAPIFEG